MKTMSGLVCVAVVGVLLSTAYRAGAVPVTYVYTGSNYTQTNGPAVPGFTLTDFVTATITLDSSLWGMTVNTPGGGTITSGPYQVGTDAFHVTTDLFGNIVAWGLSGAIPGLDISTGGAANGSGIDNIFGDRPTAGETTLAAQVQYQPGSRPAGIGWRILSVPDSSPSVLLFLLVLAPMMWLGSAGYLSTSRAA